eukprot:Gb_30637 [translate_table: standard]
MLGKRPRPAMRRTTSMSQLGSGPGFEKIPLNEYNPKEKQRTPFPISPQLRAPSPGSVQHNSNGFNISNLKNTPCDTMPGNGRYNNGLFNQPSGDGLPKGIGMGMTPDLLSSPIQSSMVSQGQFPSIYVSNHVGLPSYSAITSPMGWEGGIRRDHFLARSDTFPPVRSSGGLIQPAHFLQACFLCKRRLGHGRDIYMYRDDRAFCSAECRQQQIVVDERKEKCSVKVMASGSGSSSRHQNFGNKNVQSGAAKSVQSGRGAVA